MTGFFLFPERPSRAIRLLLCTAFFSQVSIMKKQSIPIIAAVMLLIAFVSVSLSAQAQTFEAAPDFSCDHTVSQYATDGRAENIRPGDIVCIPAGEHGRLLFQHIEGTASNPVIIRNSGGVARIYSDTGFGIKFEDSKHFVFSGDGTDDPFGIRISAERGFYLTMENFTTDFEITRIEIAGPNKNGLGANGGFAGIGVKTSPYEDCQLFTDPTRRAWIMRNISIHHNYIHDTGGEGLYIGHGFYKGRKEADCPRVTYSHSIKGVRIYNNFIENVGLDGIQIKNADEDVKVYSNIVHNYGMAGTGPHNEGLFIGEGTVGEFYDNTIDTGSGNGAQIQALGNVRLYDNVFIGAGENGIYAAGSEAVDRLPNGYFDIRDNIVFGWGSNASAFIFFNPTGGKKTFTGNIVIGRGEFTRPGADVEIADNLISDESALISGLGSIIEDYRKNYEF